MTHITSSEAGVALFRGTAETKDMNTIRSLSLIPYRLVSVFPMAGFFVTYAREMGKAINISDSSENQTEKVTFL